MRKNIARAFEPPRDLYDVKRVTKEIARNDDARREEEVREKQIR